MSHVTGTCSNRMTCMTRAHRAQCCTTVMARQKRSIRTNGIHINVYLKYSYPKHIPNICPKYIYPKYISQIYVPQMYLAPMFKYIWCTYIWEMYLGYIYLGHIFGICLGYEYLRYTFICIWECCTTEMAWQKRTIRLREICLGCIYLGYIFGIYLGYVYLRYIHVYVFGNVARQ